MNGHLLRSFASWSEPNDFLRLNLCLYFLGAVSRPCPSRSVWLEPPTVKFTPRPLVGVAPAFLDPPTRQIAPRQDLDATGLRKLVGRLPLRSVRPGRRRRLVPGRRVPLHQARGPADAFHVDPEPHRARDQHCESQGQTHPLAQFSRAGDLIRDPVSRGRHRRGKVRASLLRPPPSPWLPRSP